MRINVYKEEMTDRIEIIEKETKDGKFTGLRIYLELPVTRDVCLFCNGIQNSGLPPKCSVNRTGEHHFNEVHIHGPFMHHPGDDDSSAVTFWGKRDLREVLKKAIEELDKHYGSKR